MTGKLKEQLERKKKPKTIKNRNNKLWKDLDELRQEEALFELENLRIKNRVQDFLDKQKKKRYDEQKNIDEEEEARKLVEEEEARKLAADSEQFFLAYENQQKHNPFFDSDDDMGSSFGKKQKKDIKGMIKKILLYGGLPTLVVVSLGVLSNKKFGKGKIKKSSKIKVSEEEKLFKQVFVKKLKEIILKRKKELDALNKDARQNEIELQNRQINRKKQRDLMANAAIRRQLKINKPSSNPQSSIRTPPSNVNRLELIRKRQQQSLPRNKIFIRIDKRNQEWFYEEEKNSNYYIKNGKIYNKTTKKSTNYIYTDKDGLALKTNNQIQPFFKTEKLKKE